MLIFNGQGGRPVSNQMVSYPIKLAQGKVSLSFFFGDDQARKYTWITDRHCNAEYELHIILKGACTVDVEDKQFEMEEKQALLIAPGMYHKPHVKMKDFERFSLGFSVSEGALSKALEKKVQQSLCFNPSDALLEYCNLFVRESMYFHPTKDLALKALASLLTIALFRDLQVLKNDKSDNKMLNEKERTAVIDNFFESSFAQKKGCAGLAEQLHLSTRQLNRYLKKYYGMGFQEKLIRTRMDQAAALLRTTNKSVQDIMGFVGYNSITAFYKAFSLKFGVTPQQYRKQNGRASQNDPE